jgi:prepilin-type N-terminal cleavage/methylation domain-containing protein
MKKGFTLLEAALAMAILSMIVYLASTSFLSLIPKYQLEKSVWEIRSALNAARYKSLFEGVSYRVRFSDNGYTVEKYDDTAKKWNVAGRRTLEGATVEANNAPLFTPEGTVSGLATITVSNVRGKYKITLAITGRIKSTRIS